MSDSPYPSQTQDKFVLRLPDGMRDRIKAAAEANNRSMNSEIVATLEEKYPRPINRDFDFGDLYRIMDRVHEGHGEVEQDYLLDEANRMLDAINAPVRLRFSGELDQYGNRQLTMIMPRRTD